MSFYSLLCQKRRFKEFFGFQNFIVTLMIRHNSQINNHLFGDAAYTIHEHLLPPYCDNRHLTNRQKNFNFCHISARMTIERLFDLL